MKNLSKDRFSERQAAKILGISPQTLKAYRLSGKIYPESTHGVIIYTQQSLEQFRLVYLPIIEANRKKCGWGTTRDESGKSFFPKDLVEKLVTQALAESKIEFYGGKK
jgi:hypothetical protein